MKTWTKQMGHPVVTITIIDNQTIKLTQNHFLLDPSTPPTVPSDFKYKR
jgi:aminopeptidase N